MLRDNIIIRDTDIMRVPESEMWLQHNKEAKESVARGIEQARNLDFVDGPDLDADAALFDE